MAVFLSSRSILSPHIYRPSAVILAHSQVCMAPTQETFPGSWPSEFAQPPIVTEEDDYTPVSSGTPSEHFSAPEGTSEDPTAVEPTPSGSPPVELRTPVHQPPTLVEQPARRITSRRHREHNSDPNLDPNVISLNSNAKYA
jgi:hypothetical protein